MLTSERMGAGIGAALSARARELGADLVGFVPSQHLRKSPSRHTEGARFGASGLDLGHINNLEHSPYDLGDGWTAVVIAVSHPASRPELDWFKSSGNTPGNANLIRITRELATWLEHAEHRSTIPLHYYVEKGGIYLKDAAVHAGLGCVGMNNLLVTPEFGPRVRLRALMVNANLEGTGPIDFDPCRNCVQYCRSVCPQGAFADDSNDSSDDGAIQLPGRDDSYVRARCLVQMDGEWAALGSDAQDTTTLGMDDEVGCAAAEHVVKHCRLCELACPAGSTSCT